MQWHWSSVSASSVLPRLDSHLTHQLDLHLLFANLMELVQLVFHGLGSIMFIGIVQTYRLGVTLAERLPKPHINNIVLTLDNFHRKILVRISIAIVFTI